MAGYSSAVSRCGSHAEIMRMRTIILHACQELYQLTAPIHTQCPYESPGEPCKAGRAGAFTGFVGAEAGPVLQLLLKHLAQPGLFSPASTLCPPPRSANCFSLLFWSLPWIPALQSRAQLLGAEWMADPSPAQLASSIHFWSMLTRLTGPCPPWELVFQAHVGTW